MRALAECPDIDPVLSLAGRTRDAPDRGVPTRVGGFGGAAGLAAHLLDERVAVLVDATHPFAARMSRHAMAASEQTGCPLVLFSRPAWTPSDGDRWQEVADMDAAAAALGPLRRRIFLTIGRQQLAAFAAAPQHSYLVRSIEPPASGHGLADALFLQARGPFAVADEERLMREHGIDVLVTKNSGGEASVAKLEAARRLQLPVVLVRRPAEARESATGVAEAVAAIRAHLEAPAPRGV